MPVSCAITLLHILFTGDGAAPQHYSKAYIQRSSPTILVVNGSLPASLPEVGFPYTNVEKAILHPQTIPVRLRANETAEEYQEGILKTYPVGHIETAALATKRRIHHNDTVAAETAQLMPRNEVPVPGMHFDDVIWDGTILAETDLIDTTHPSIVPVSHSRNGDRESASRKIKRSLVTMLTSSNLYFHRCARPDIH